SVARPHRLEPAQFIEARRGEACDVREVVLREKPHRQRTRMPAAGDETTELGQLGPDGVDVKRLRIETPGEGNDLILLDRDAATAMDVACDVVLEVPVVGRIAECHD